MYFNQALLLISSLIVLHTVNGANLPPQFVNATAVMLVNESSSIGHKIDKIVAEDSDSPVLHFEIIGDLANQILKLEYVDGSTQSVWVILDDNIDRESINNYVFAIRVDDTVNQPLDLYAQLIITDANDNNPLFQDLPYKAEIREDAALGAFVFKVYATDADQGSFAIVNYAITTPQDLYAINPSQGNVTLNGELDYEVTTFYQLEILAYDNFGLESTTDLVINVLDVQDTAPYFTNLPYMENVEENLAAGSTVLTVTALDGDRGIPNNVTYSFESGNHQWFELDVNSGAISVGPGGLDREDSDILDLFGVLEFVVRAEEVTSVPQGPTTATAHVTVRVTDVNDQTPTFDQPAYTGSVLENTQQTIPVTMDTDVFVSDYDENENGRFEVVLEKDGQAFDVFDVVPSPILNEANLLIRVKNASALDFEVVQTYVFEAVARELDTAEKQESRASISITLEDVNDNWPEFPGDQYLAQILENSPRGTPVTTITATDKDSGSFGTVTYELRGASANLSLDVETDWSQKGFGVDADGNVFVNVDADVDLSLLDREKQDSHYLNFEAVDGGNLRTSVPLVVTLLDVNDNSPVILRDGYEGYVQENDVLLERRVFVEATDDDLPPYNIVTFSIIAGDSLNNFTINATTGEIGLAGPLDYESLPPGSNGLYTLTVKAEDGGSPPLSHTTEVLINVEDQNDEEPYFDDDLYESTIPENSQGGTNVTQVRADDDDGTGPNNELIYRIDSGGLDKFRIDATSGLIQVEIGANMDRDLYETEYNLQILAIDKGTPPLTGTSTVYVQISDINNKFPVFSPPQQSTSLLESTVPNTDFFTYTATDLDLDAVLRYSLLDDLVYGEDENKNELTEPSDQVYLASLFGIRADTGTVHVASDLDRESAELIRITILVEDLNAAEPAVQNATATLTITLTDVNDNPPEFIPSAEYMALVPESSTVGFEVKKVEAVDRDKNVFPIEYYIVEEPGNPQSQSFEITDANRQLGMITLASQVDFETDQQITLTVRAVDGSLQQLSSSATVVVTVEDVNDNSPQWQVFEGQVSVSEDAAINTNVTNVFATDMDSEEYGRVMYYIVGGGDRGDFHLDNTTGLLTTSDSLDRERFASYSLTIEARDNNGAPANQQRVTPGYMTITLIDVNDNSPIFDQPSYYDETQENIPVNTDIVTVLATDEDADSNSAIAYSLDYTNGNGTGLFKIHPSSGLISTALPLTGQFGHFYFDAVATDGGTPAKSNTTLIHVFVQDVNDHAPDIVHPPSNDSTEHIYEHAVIGYEVVTVVAEDEDIGKNGEVEYEFVTSQSSRPDYEFFSIDRQTGTITVAKDIDREVQSTYYLDVRAYDLGDEPKEAILTLTVIALDTDDNPPVFDRQLYPPPYGVSVHEEQSDVKVANLSLATDSDIGNNSVICYYIVGGDMPYKDQFGMNKTTGQLWLGPRIDREVVNDVHLIVKASEDCWTGFWEDPANTNQEWNATDLSTLLVQVAILDINDNPPRFTRRWFSDGVTKDTQFAEEVIDVSEHTVDPDIGNNSLLTYHINSTFHFSSSDLRNDFDDAPFTIGLYDGIIRTNSYFEDDQEGFIQFVIKVADMDPNQFDRVNISIYLLNQDQRVIVVIRGEPEEVQDFQDEFAEYLSNVTGVLVNVDQILTHKDSSGNPDPRKTDMFIHGIDPHTGEVLDADQLIDLIDSNYAALADLFKRYNVIEVKPAIEEDSGKSIDRTVMFSLIAVAALLLLIILVVVGTFVVCRKKYKRKLKAATAVAYGSNDGTLNHMDTPNTNLHAFEGSNPVWLEKYDQGWPKETDVDTDSKNSLDENDVVPTFTKGYDEHERSMEMYNDELDQYGRVMAANRAGPGDAVLRAAIEAHKQQNIDANSQAELISASSSNPQTPSSMRSQKVVNNGVPNGGMTAHNGGIAENGHMNIPQTSVTSPNVPPYYSNQVYEMEATEI